MTSVQARISDTVARARPVLEAIGRAGGVPLIVGGAVRDILRGEDAHDIDIEVYGLNVDALMSVLEPLGKLNAVGRSFGVLKLRTPDRNEYDIALPQRGSRNTSGQRGAISTADPTMTPREAAARRDFTWNALAITSSGELLDFFGGVEDLRNGLVRHISDAFGEDPLRVLRAVRFAARFDMRLAPKTAELCRVLLPEAAALPIERVWGEWHKWALTSFPQRGLQVLEETTWIHLYPELSALRHCLQSPTYHPEGDVLTHTQFVCQAAAKIAERERLASESRAILLFASLCHDLGKPATTQVEGGRIRSLGHAEAGVPLTESFLTRIGAPQHITRQAVPLVREHMAHAGAKPTSRAVRRLASRLLPATIEQWGQLVEADHSGRPPLPPTNPSVPFVALARELHIAHGPPSPILNGRDLIEAGYSVGPEMGAILKRAYQAQLDGAFSTLEEALAWLHSTND